MYKLTHITFTSSIVAMTLSTGFGCDTATNDDVSNVVPTDDGGKADDPSQPVSSTSIYGDDPLILVGDQEGGSFGGALAIADLDGDGRPDVIVGEPMYSTDSDRGWEGTWSGRVHVYFSGADGLSTADHWSMVGPHEYSHFGAQLAPAGDIDGDGLADVLVADNWNVYVIFGASDRALGRRSEVRVAAGYVPVMAAAGDIDGDGFGDIVVGDSAYNPSGRYGDYPGRALAFRGSADGLLPDPIWTVTGRPWVETDPHRPSDYVGAAIAAVGHGVVVGGRQLAYYPREDGGLASEPTWTPHETIVLPDGQGTLTPPFAAHAIALGDVTGDGIEDLVTSASHRLLMFPGTTAGFGDPAWDHQDTRANTIIAADLDGDGLGDIVAGDRILEHDEVYFQGYGYVHYYLSALSGLPAAASGTLEFALETGWYRASRALIGNAKAAADLDGDGSVELILGAPFDGDWGSTFERVYLPGRVLVFSVSP